MGYKFGVHYKSGKENTTVDALSHRGEMELKATPVWQYNDLEK